MDVLHGFLPLEVKLVALLMESAEFFGSLVKLDLGGLSLSDFVLELLSFAGNLDGELLNLEGKFFDLGLVGTPVLF